MMKLWEKEDLNCLAERSKELLLLELCSSRHLLCVLMKLLLLWILRLKKKSSNLLKKSRKVALL